MQKHPAKVLWQNSFPEKFLKLPKEHLQRRAIFKNAVLKPDVCTSSQMFFRIFFLELWGLLIIWFSSWVLAIFQRWTMPEAVGRKCSVKRLLLKISQNSQESTGVLQNTSGGCICYARHLDLTFSIANPKSHIPKAYSCSWWKGNSLKD